jgi:HD superfamily phosphodiesterase
MTDGPLEDRDCQKNPVTRLEATSEFLKRRDEQMTQLKISEITEIELKSSVSQDDLFQLSLKLLKDVKKLRTYIKREEIFETDLAKMNFEEIFKIIKNSGEIKNRKTTVKVMTATVVCDRNGRFVSLKTSQSGKVKPTSNPDWLNHLCIRRKTSTGDRLITDGNSKLQRLVEVI